MLIYPWESMYGIFTCIWDRWYMWVLMLHALILRVKEAFNVNRLCTYPGCYGPHIRIDKTRYTTGQHLYGVSPLTSWWLRHPSSVWWTIALSIHKRTGLDCKVANLNADMAAQISACRLVCWVKTLFTSPSVLPKLHTIILVRMLTYLI